MRRALLLASLVSLTAVGLGAGTANAEEFCVNKLPCAGTNHTTIQAALDAAAANGFEDTVFIDANGGTPYAESPSYTDEAEIVHIVGDGVDQTIIEGTGSPSNAVTLLGQGSSIQDLTIRIPEVENGAALRWNGAIASNIRATHTGSTATSTYGMVAEGNAILEDSTVEVNGFGLFTILNNANDVGIQDSTLLGSGRGIEVGDGNLTLQRSTVASARSPIAAGFGGNITVFNAVLRQTGTLPADGAIYLLSGAEGIVRHATVIGADAGRGVLIDATSSSVTLTIYDSIIDGFATSLLCAGTAGTATLGISYSNWTDPTELTDPECNETLGAGNDMVTNPVYVSTNPLFLDFRLKAPSPLIDAGDPADPLTVDLVTAPRPVDGDGIEGARSDMGAYEYQRQAPSAAISAPETATVGQAAEFSASGSSDPDPGDALTYDWDFGDGSTAEGFAPEHSFAAAGTFTVELTVTDPTGLSDTASALVQVAATTAPAPDKPGKGPKKPKKPKKPKPQAGPTITELRAVPRRIRRGKGLPKLVKGLKRPGFQFKISRKAEVRLTLVRCKGKRDCKKRVRVPGAASFSAFAGSNTIKFRGRLTGRKLRRGRYRARLKAIGGNALSTPFRLVR